MRDLAETIIRSRDGLSVRHPMSDTRSQEAEGGCGVIGLASSKPIKGKYLITPCAQMCNRGNGKGGGVAVAGCFPHYADHFAVQVGYLDLNARREIEQKYLFPMFDIAQIEEQPFVEDYREFPRLDIEPPRVVRYFSRVKAGVLDRFATEHGFTDQRAAEEEFVFQNSFRLNKEFYGDREDKQGFVLSHGRNMMILKAVGYAEDIAEYYRLHDLAANVWIGHQRYPTRGRVWHPGGAHPFSGLDEALVHNGDFANYASVCTYLAQRNIEPLFLTDTEVSVLVFDLLHRTYGYPLEYVIEALAPTTERDFHRLPPDRRRVYEMLQAIHMHGSPDGPWFFLIAQSAEGAAGPAAPREARLIGITDTSMLRPQVFALQRGGDGDPQVGFAASEKQAIDAALDSLARADRRFGRLPDRVWNARGGSHTDGGAFVFRVIRSAVDEGRLVCTDKFGQEVEVKRHGAPHRRGTGRSARPAAKPIAGDAAKDFAAISSGLARWSYDDLTAAIAGLLERSAGDEGRRSSIETLTMLLDRRYATGNLRARSVRELCLEGLESIWDSIRRSPSEGYAWWGEGQPIPSSAPGDRTLLLDGRGVPPDGPRSLARRVCDAIEAGYRRLMLVHTRGHRFLGSGLGATTFGVRIDVYGSPGDYLASGLDGAEIVVHANGQDQLAQIMKAGRLVVHGDVGQTFMYAAKGGQAFILGNAAGRPMINAVGKPRVVINGTCLDYLAESFMAGDPLAGGGFVILNAVAFDEEGRLRDLPEPYPGGNLFSLASGGAIFLRDPDRRVGADQLNGGEFGAFRDEHWERVRPMLEENERLFGIRLADLLTVRGEVRSPSEVYRVVQPAGHKALMPEEAWVAHT